MAIQQVIDNLLSRLKSDR